MGGQNLGTSRQSLVSWSVVDSETQERFGLVSISTGCSGCLVRSDWVVSAAHCFELKDASNKPIPDPSRPGQFMLQPLVSVSVTANWPGTLKDRAVGRGTSTSHTRWVKRIETFRPYDVALVEVTEPFSTPSLPAGEARMVNADGQFPYFGEEMSMHLTVFGRGINQFATGSGDTAKPSSSDGQYRLGYAKVDDRSENLYWYSGGAGGYIAGGDSGGPSFCWTYSGYALVGVHALAQKEVVPGKDTKTEPWKWVTSTPKAADAPLRPLAAQMAAVMGPLPKRQAAETGFIGVFPNSGPSAD